MRGTVDWQVTEIFKTVNNLGTSKHEAKELARADGAKTFEQVGQKIGVHSNSTYDDFTAIAKAACEYAKGEFGLRDVTRIETHMIQSFLLDKIENGGRENDGILRATYNTYSSGLHKLQLALNTYSETKNLAKTYDFGLKEVGKYAAEKLGDKCTDSRAYKNVDQLVAAVPGRYNLLAKVLRETGFRISEGSRIAGDQLKGLKPDLYDHKEKFWIGANGKGGKYYERPVSEQTYRSLEKIIAEKGVFNVNQGNFRTALQAAAATSGQKYEGPHGIRWSVAQERHAELQKLGYSYESSLKIVSSELNHIRGDITRHYLK